MNPVTLDLLILMFIFAINTLGLNLVVGFARIFSVNQAVLFGVGAFSYAYCVNRLHNGDLFLAALVAVAISALCSTVVSTIALRVSGDYFVVASFGFQIVLLQVLYNWTWVSGGPSGIFGLPYPSLFGWTISDQQSYLYLAGISCAVVFAVVWWIVRSPFGRLIRAMGANETALASGGFNAVYIRVQTFVAGGMLAALSGVLYAGYNGIVQVSDYSYLVSITLLTMVVIGGAGSIVGSLIGAAIVVIVPQQLNNLAVASTISGPLQQLLFGGVLLIVMLFFPAGIADLLQRGFTRIRGLFQPSRQGITANAPAMSPAEKESQP